MNTEILEEILNKYNTPTYVFDINKLNDRIDYLKSHLSKRIKLCYAIKANTFIVEDVEEKIDRYEVCSPGEYYICREKNIPKDKILISGVYKTPDVIKEMILEDGITNFTIESMEQFDLIKEIEYNSKINLLIRITSGNQFGINEEDAEEIIKVRNQYPNINISGIQYFSGTQKKSIKNIAREIEKMQEFMKIMNEEYGYEAKELEFGGGFPIQYFQNDEFDEETFLKEFSEIIDQIEFDGDIIIELGRSIVADCGYYVTKVVDKKTNKDQNYAILDGGINHLVYYGQSMAMKIPKCEVYPKREDTEKRWNLCGSLCTINDILVKQFPAGDLEIGDVFIFKNTGAYCITEGISLFLSRELPSVIKLKDGKTELVRENVSTYKLNM